MRVHSTHNMIVSGIFILLYDFIYGKRILCIPQIPVKEWAEAT